MGNKKRLILYGVMVVILMSLVGVFAGIYYANSEEEKEANQPNENIRSELWEETKVFYEYVGDKTDNIIEGKEQYKDGPVDAWVVKWSEKLNIEGTTREEYELFYRMNNYYTASIRLQSSYADETSKGDREILKNEYDKAKEVIEKLLYK